MEMRWLFQAHYFILTHFMLTHVIGAQSEIIIKNEETIYAFPGDDVTLTCSILKRKGIHVTQTQWSKVDDVYRRSIGVYNPRYGTTYAEKSYNYSMNFRKAFQYCQLDFSHSSFSANYTECDQWVLQMRNVSLEQFGFYECSFATFPAGTSSSEINLVIMKTDDKNFVAETLVNQTLEIPCLKEVPYENLTNASLKWFLKENKNEELLISKQSYYAHGFITSPTEFKNRIKMNLENTLMISPVSVLDDGKKFVCSLYQPGRIIKSTTVVRVFVKPEISITLNASFRGKANFTCVVRKAFPKPKLLWYMDGEILKDKSEGILIEKKETNVVGGFYEMRSLLTIWSTTQLPVNQAFRCMAVYPFPGNQIQNVSSEEVVFSYGLQETTSESLKPSRQVPPILDSTTGKPWSSTKDLQVKTVASSSSFSTVLQRYHYSTKDLQDKTRASFSSFSPVLQRNLSTTRIDEQSTRTVHDNSFTVKFNSTRNLFTERVAVQTTMSSPDNSPTLKGWFNNTGTATSPEHRHFSWPAVVAALLFFCTFLIILGIRKWCQYQKEIMNRPPSFKPPPPPIKYTSMPVCAGSYISCNELENL